MDAELSELNFHLLLKEASYIAVLNSYKLRPVSYVYKEVHSLIILANSFRLRSTQNFPNSCSLRSDHCKLQNH